MKRYGVPRIAYVNKMDNPGANYDRVAAMLKEKLGHHAVKIQMPIGAEDKFRGIIDPILGKAYYFDGENGEVIRDRGSAAELAEATKARRHEIVEGVAEVDDQLAEKFLAEEPVSNEELWAAIRRATIALKMTPVMCGSAFRNKGVQLLLDGVIHYLPNPTEVVNEAHDQSNAEAKVILESAPDKPFVGLAFKLQQDKYGQLTYFRIYQGTVRTGETIINTSNQMRKVRVPRMFRMHSDDREEISEAPAGDIVALYGVEASSGETFTDGKVNVTMTSMHVPGRGHLAGCGPQGPQRPRSNFSKALNRFTKEDPTFRVHQDEESAQTIISGMGELHLDIYMERMRREYNCDVIAGKPQVAFRETVTQRGEFAYTHKKQTGGSGQFARVCGFLEPLPPDAVETYEFVDEIVGGVHPPRVHPGLRQGLQGGCQAGHAHRIPDRRRPRGDQRRRGPRRRLLGAGVQDGGADGLPRRLRSGQTHHPRADHEGRGRGARGVPGVGGRPGEPAPRRDPGDQDRRRQRHRDGRGPAEHHVRLLHGSPLGDAGQGQLHHGVRQVLPRPPQ